MKLPTPAEPSSSSKDLYRRTAEAFTSAATRLITLPMLARGLAIVLAAVVVLLPVLRGSQPALAAAGAVPSVTDPRYFAGVNVPWFNWGYDFGGGQKNGASSPAVRAALAEGFGRLKAAGVHTVRWWTFEGDPSQITRDASGAPTGLNPAVYADFDAALALADQYDLAYDFVLFHAPTAVPRAWIVDPDQRQRLANALAPLFERYKDHPRILAWEIINEPEYDIWGNKIPLEAVQATVKLLATTVHAHTRTAVTVGEATLEGVPLWSGLGLDFHSPHWYDQMDSGLMCARCSDMATIRAAYKFDRLPIVLGEFYGGPDVDTLQRLKDFRTKGFAGAWTWSLFYDKTAADDQKRTDLSAITRFNADPEAAPVEPAAAPEAAITVQLLANWVSPTYASPGQVITFHQDVRSTLDTTVLVDFEVFDNKGQKVSQTALDNQALTAGGLASISTMYTLPGSLPPGQYVLKTGAFSPGWGTMYAWSDTAGVFVVAPSGLGSPQASDTVAPATDTTAPEPDAPIN